MAEALEEILQGPCFLVIELPPRHGKTETLLHFIAWYLDQLPGSTIAYASYAQHFSESKTLKAQRYALEAGVEPDAKMQNRSEWRTKQGGGILTTSIAGALTGQGVNVMLIDDPVKDRATAESVVYRERSWAWFEDVAETRLEPGASVVVTQTRWHESDLAGMVLANRPEYRVIRLPALADGLDGLGKEAMADLVGRNEGEALWPERFDEELLSELKEKKPWTFASLYQGLPRPRDGKVFGPAHYYQTLPDGLRWGFGGDLAYTKKSRANKTTLARVGRLGDVFYVGKVWAWQEDITYTAAQYKSLLGGDAVRLEDNGPQKGVNDALENLGVRINRFTPVSDKLARGAGFIEAWNAGRVLLPDPVANPGAKQWVSEALEVLGNFTGVNDAQDDEYDGLVNAFEQVSETPYVWGAA